MKSCLLAAAVLAFGASVSLAGTICPAGSGANPFPHSPDNANTGCNTVITINSNGSVSITVQDSTPYEESEDVLVGVKNNSSSPVTQLSISGGAGSGIFGFDGDGICTFTFVGNSYCSAAQYQTDPGDYAGPTSSFTNFSTGDSGVVVFNPAVAANGGTTYFSLEGIPTASLTTTVGTGPTTTTTNPAPSSITLLAVGFAVVLIFEWRRRLARA